MDCPTKDLFLFYLRSLSDEGSWKKYSDDLGLLLNPNRLDDGFRTEFPFSTDTLVTNGHNAPAKSIHKKSNVIKKIHNLYVTDWAYMTLLLSTWSRFIIGSNSFAVLIYLKDTKVRIIQFVGAVGSAYPWPLLVDVSRRPPLILSVSLDRRIWNL